MLRMWIGDTQCQWDEWVNKNALQFESMQKQNQDKVNIVWSVEQFTDCCKS